MQYVGFAGAAISGSTPFSLDVIPAKAHCCPGKFLVDSADGYKAAERFNLAFRHSRESGNPSCFCIRAKWIPAFAGTTAEWNGTLREHLVVEGFQRFFPDSSALSRSALNRKASQ